MVTGRERSTIQAEAAAWLARLHSPSKSAVSEGAFRTWLEQDERHREEFEKATEVWDLIGSVPRPADAANEAGAEKGNMPGRMPWGMDKSPSGQVRHVAVTGQLANPGTDVNRFLGV